MVRRAFVCVALLLAALATGTRAQTPPSPDANEVQVWLLTLSPGDQPHEVFGHNALIVIRNGRGELYNWGTFSFGSSTADFLKFAGNFVQGRLIYWLSVEDAPTRQFWSAVRAIYEGELGRQVTLQQLDLDLPQTARLLEALDRNALPENVKYRYDYYRDNCSTRVRDMIDIATGGALKAATDSPAAEGHTFRWHTRRMAQRSPWLFVALDFVMGHPIDRPLTRWDECFLPDQLSLAVSALELKSADGTSRPLVTRQSVWDANEQREKVPTAPPVAWPWFLAIGVSLGALFAAGRVSGLRWLGWVAGLVAAVVCLVGGLGAAINLYGWAFTDHAVAAWDENVLQLSPLLIPLIALAPLAMFRRRSGRLTFLLAVGGLALSVLGLLLKPLPGAVQPNWNFIASSLPIHAGLVVMLWHRPRVTESAPELAPA
jgi:hypothetical protein